MSSHSNSTGREHQIPSPSTVRRQYEEDRLQQEKEQRYNNSSISEAAASSSSSLFHEYYQQQSIESDINENYLSEAWNVPTQAEMKRRLSIRQYMLEETLSHRRNTFKQTSFTKNGRNITAVLRDRSVYGSSKRPSYYFTAQQVKDRSNRLSYQAESEGEFGETREEETTPSTFSSNNFPFPASDTVTKELRTFMEYCSVTRYEAGYFKHLGGQDGRQENGEDQEEEDTSSASQQQQPRPPPTRPASSKAVSTISIAFSPDAATQASTHGDHTVKITKCWNGELLKQLVGHPRTPWTVKYHPVDGNIVASGCLGHQVRVWHWPSASCLQMIRLEFAIISLSFHPTGQVLAVANGTRLHFWATPVFGDSKGDAVGGDNESNEDGDDSDDDGDLKQTKKNDKKIELSSIPPPRQPASASNNNNNNPQPQDRPRGVLTEVEQRHMLRCVHFLPDGKSIIVGGVNPNSAQNRRQQPRGGISGGGMSFYLRLWDFDLQAALHPGEHLHPTRNSGLRRRAISNVRIVFVLFCDCVGCCIADHCPYILCFFVHIRSQIDSHEPLSQEHFYTMMVASMCRPMERRSVPVLSTGCPMELRMLDNSCIKAMRTKVIPTVIMRMNLPRFHQKEAIAWTYPAIPMPILLQDRRSHIPLRSLHRLLLHKTSNAEHPHPAYLVHQVDSTLRHQRLLSSHRSL